MNRCEKAKKLAFVGRLLGYRARYHRPYTRRNEASPIAAQMLFGPDPDLEVAQMPPWLDLRVPRRK